MKLIDEFYQSLPRLDSTDITPVGTLMGRIRSKNFWSPIVL